MELESATAGEANGRVEKEDSMKTTHQHEKTGRVRNRTRIMRQTFFSVTALAVGAAVAVALIETSPDIQRKPPEREARLIEVDTVRFSSQNTVVHAMGTVVPAQEVVLQPRVAGEVLAVSHELEPGGRLQKGATLLQIDPSNYELAVRQRESDVAQAESELAIELGSQSIAKHEYELLGETIRDEDRALVLREPQLKKVKASLEMAKAALEQAQINLQRTSFKVPFNATVRSREVNLGTQVNTSTPLVTLTGSDVYWTEVTVPPVRTSRLSPAVRLPKVLSSPVSLRDLGKRCPECVSNRRFFLSLSSISLR
jgi:multidrug efflux pump subunit AcrA (membrane-fusion protein)